MTKASFSDDEEGDFLFRVCLQAGIEEGEEQSGQRKGEGEGEGFQREEEISSER